MSFRNTEGKKISQLARSRTAQRRRQQSLGQNLLLYLRGNVNLGSTIQDFSMYDKKVLNLNQYSNHIKSYKAYLLSGSIYLQQARDEDNEDYNYKHSLAEEKPTIVLFKGLNHLFDLSHFPI